jgi:hypothetical protein
MRTTSVDAEAVRAAFYAVLNEMPEDRLRKLLLELLLAPFTMTTPPHPHRSRGRPRKAAIEDGNVVRLPRRRRKPAVDERKLADRRKRYAAKRKAERQAAKAAKAIKANAPAAAVGNGQDAAVAPQAFWQHAEKLEPTRPWKAVVREFGVKEAVSQQAYRSQSLPPHVGPMAINKFLMLEAPN